MNNRSLALGLLLFNSYVWGGITPSRGLILELPPKTITCQFVAPGFHNELEIEIDDLLTYGQAYTRCCQEMGVFYGDMKFSVALLMMVLPEMAGILGDEPYLGPMLHRNPEDPLDLNLDTI